MFPNIWYKMITETDYWKGKLWIVESWNFLKILLFWIIHWKFDNKYKWNICFAPFKEFIGSKITMGLPTKDVLISKHRWNASKTHFKGVHIFENDDNGPVEEIWSCDEDASHFVINLFYQKT